LYLFIFDFTLKHIPGSSIGKADSLSRHLDWQVKIKRDNEDKVLVKKEWLEVRATQMTEVIIKETDLLEKIRKSEAKIAEELFSKMRNKFGEIAEEEQKISLLFLYY